MLLKYRTKAYFYFMSQHSARKQDCGEGGIGADVLSMSCFFIRLMRASSFSANCCICTASSPWDAASALDDVMLPRLSMLSHRLPERPIEEPERLYWTSKYPQIQHASSLLISRPACRP